MSENNQEQMDEAAANNQEIQQTTDSASGTDEPMQASDSQDDTSHDTHDDSGDWTNPEYRNAQMASVRKKAEEKALERGRQEVLRELEEQYLQQQQAQQPQTNGESPNPQNQSQSNQPSKEDFMRVQKFNAYGEARYDDWKDSINALSREAQINPAIVDVVTVAANLDNGHDIVNKIAKDPKLRQELTECRPEALAKKMIRIGMQDAEHSQPKLAPRKPLSEINPASSSSGSSEISHQQKVKSNLDRIAKKMNG